MSAPQGPIRLSLFDGTGREIGVVFEGSANGGSMNIPYSMSALSTGTYYVRLQHVKGVAMMPVIKQ